MLVIGLTGGIGSGKSTVANLFANLGIPIIDADIIARDLTKSTTSTYKDIVTHFGQTILRADGELDRTALRTCIHQKAAERIWLENLLHPMIRERIQHAIAQLVAPYCLVVIPLLIETGPYPFLQRTLIVDASIDLQTARVAARDHLNHDDIAALLKIQATREQRLKQADDIIVNDGTLTDLIPQVAKLHQLYLSQVVQ